MADIRFECPHCQQHMEAPPEMGGSEVECPSCGGTICVPSSDVQVSDVPRQSGGGTEAPITVDSPPETTEVSRKVGIGRRLLSATKAMASEAKRGGQIAALTAQIEKLKRVDLPRAHRALGEKASELRMQPEEYQSAYNELAELDAAIAEKMPTVHAGEGASIGGKAMAQATTAGHRVQAEALKRKRGALLQGLGEKISEVHIHVTDIPVELGTVQKITARIDEVMLQRQQTRSGKMPPAEQSSMDQGNAGQVIQILRRKPRLAWGGIAAVAAATLVAGGLAVRKGVQITEHNRTTGLHMETSKEGEDEPSINSAPRRDHDIAWWYMLGLNEGVLVAGSQLGDKMSGRQPLSEQDAIDAIVRYVRDKGHDMTDGQEKAFTRAVREVLQGKHPAARYDPYLLIDKRKDSANSSLNSGEKSASKSGPEATPRRLTKDLDSCVNAINGLYGRLGPATKPYRLRELIEELPEHMNNDEGLKAARIEAPIVIQDLEFIPHKEKERMVQARRRQLIDSVLASVSNRLSKLDIPLVVTFDGHTQFSTPSEWPRTDTVRIGNRPERYVAFQSRLVYAEWTWRSPYLKNDTYADPRRKEQEYLWLRGDVPAGYAEWAPSRRLYKGRPDERWNEGNVSEYCDLFAIVSGNTLDVCPRQCRADTARRLKHGLAEVVFWVRYSPWITLKIIPETTSDRSVRDFVQVQQQLSFKETRMPIVCTGGLEVNGQILEWPFLARDFDSLVPQPPGAVQDMGAE